MKIHSDPRWNIDLFKWLYQKKVHFKKQRKKMYKLGSISGKKVFVMNLWKSQDSLTIGN